MPVEVLAIPDERLPAPVEAAAYFVLSETLVNVQKYAGGPERRRRVVERQDGLLVVDVRDDGVGGADVARGSGLRGLVDRVEALDGRLRLHSPPGGGTHVRAEIPLTA